MNGGACEATIALGCNPTLPTAADAIEDAGPVTDACGEVTETATAPNATAEGFDYTQTWTVTAEDECGNTSQYPVTYNWRIDTQAPVLACPPSPVNLGCNPVVGNDEYL